MTHRQAVAAELRAIPAHRWRYKIAKLLIAVGLVALLYYVAIPQKWSPKLVLGIVAAIGYCVSEDFVKAFFKFAIAIARDLVALLPGKTDAPPPASPPRVTP